MDEGDVLRTGDTARVAETITFRIDGGSRRALAVLTHDGTLSQRPFEQL